MRSCRMIPLLVITSIVALPLLNGCAGTSKLRMDSLASISLGLSPADLAQTLDKKPKMVLAIEDSTDTVAEVYDMVTGTEMVYGAIYAGPRNTIPTAKTVETTEPYFMLFRSGRLVYWGFLNEFGRAEDPEVRRLSTLIAETHAAEKKRRAQLRRSEF